MAKTFCPNCRSTDITFQREHSGIVGAHTNTVVVKEAKRNKGLLYWLFFGWWYWLMFGWWIRLIFGGGSHGGLGYSASKDINRTIAMCQDCGYTWTVKQPQKQSKVTPGAVLGIIAGVFAICLILYALVGKGRFRETIEEHVPNEAVDMVDMVKQTETLDEFSYEIDGNTISLNQYNGNNETLEILSAYGIDGKEYATKLSDFQVGIGNSTVKTLILDDGITEIKASIFNSCEVEKIFFPKSMTLIYDNTLSYLHPRDGQTVGIYYAGTEEEWANIFTEYQRKDIKDAEFGEEMGVAAADKLNEMMGAEYDSSLFEYHFSAQPSDLLQ